MLVGDPDPVFELRAGEDVGDQLCLRQRSSAVLSSLNAIPSAAALLAAPLVTRVRSLTVAKLDA